MKSNIIKCQTGFDYDIFGLKQNIIMQTIFNLNILIDNSTIIKSAFNKSFDLLDIKLECEDNLR